MTHRCEGDGKCEIGKWREAIGELNPRTDQLLSEPNAVHNTLDDAVFI